MSVKKIFMTLIVIVMCVILGAFLINILLPNVTATLINAAEQQIFNATGMKFDFNNDSVIGGNTTNNTFEGTEGSGTQMGGAEGNVAGFQ